MKMITLTLILNMFSCILTAPPYQSGYIVMPEEINPFETLWKATCKVESSNNQFAIGDKHLKQWSYGLVQVRQARLDDYYRRTGVRYSTDDMFDPVKAKRVFMWYASQFNPCQIEAISRSWNGGNNYKQKKSTEKYFLKIQKSLLSL